METTLFRLPDDGWYNIAIAGDFPHAAGYIQVLDEDAMRSMAGEIHGFAADAAWPGILVDFDHQSLDLEKPSTAAGWIVDAEYRPSGLWAKIRWSSKGREALEGGTFRFISPVWTVGDCEELGDKRLRPRHLMNCAVTNCPNIRGMVPLSNREPQGVRLTVPARPLGLLRVEPPRMRSWAALANRSRLADGMRVLPNSSGRQRSEEELKAIFAKKFGGGSSVGGSGSASSPAYSGAAAADNAASSATSSFSSAEDLTPYFSPEALSDINSRYNLSTGYDGREGTTRLSAAARIRQLEMDRETLQGMLRELPTAPATKKISIQKARELAMKNGWNVLDVVEEAKRINEQVANYNRQRFRIKKEYKGKAGLDAALNRLDRLTNENYLKKLREDEAYNARINLRINDINQEIAKVAGEQRSSIDKAHEKEDLAKQKAEERAANHAARLEAARIKAQAYADNQRKKAEAYAESVAMRTQADSEAAAAKAKSDLERAQAKAAESDKRRQAYAESATGLRNYYDFVRSGNFEAADKLYPNVNHAETKSYLDKLTTSQAFTSKSSGFQQAILRQIEHAKPQEVAAMFQNPNLQALLNRRDMVAYVLANASPMTDQQRKAMFARMGGGGSGSGGGGAPIYSAASGGGGGGGYTGPLTGRVTGGVGNNRTSNWVLSLTPEQFQEELKNNPDRLREAIADQIREGAYTGIQINGHGVDVDDIINYGIAPLKPATVVVGSGKTDPLAGLTAQAINPDGTPFASGSSRLQSAYQILQSGTPGEGTSSGSSGSSSGGSGSSGGGSPGGGSPGGGGGSETGGGNAGGGTTSGGTDSPTGGTNADLDSQVSGLQQVLLSFGWDWRQTPDGTILKRLRNRSFFSGLLANAGGAMTDEQRKAMFARLHGGGGGGGGGSSTPAYTGHGDSETNPWKAAFKGFFEGAREGAENDVNALSFGLTDKFGITHSYDNTGTANDISKGLATIGSLAAYSAFGAAAMGGAGIGLGSVAGLGEGGIVEIGAKAGQEALRDFDAHQTLIEKFGYALDSIRRSSLGQPVSDVFSRLDSLERSALEAGLDYLPEPIRAWESYSPIGDNEAVPVSEWYLSSLSENAPAIGREVSDFMSDLFANPGLRSEFEYLTP